MDVAQASGVQAFDVPFPDGSDAKAVLAGHRRSATALLDALGLAGPRPVLVVAGAADTLAPDVARRLRPVLDAVIGSARETGAAMLDGATASGIMAVLGDAMASADAAVPLVGVAPAGLVAFPGNPRVPVPTTALAPGHSHFVLADSDEWGGETPTLFALVAAFAPRRSAMLLAGGGVGALGEALLAVRAGMPVVVLDGSGGIADVIAAAVAPRRTSAPRQPLDAAVAEIVASGNVRSVSLDADPAVVARHVERLLAEDTTLCWAWVQYHAVTLTARRQQRSFYNQQGIVLALGLLGTSLVTVEAALTAAAGATVPQLLAAALRTAIILVPILASVFVAIAARFRPGARWILLRGTAESVKREIYRYRTGTGAYRRRPGGDSPEERLADAVGHAVATLMRTEVSLASLVEDDAADFAASHTARGDDGMSRLSADDYLRFRIDDQVAFYRDRVARRERHVFRLRVAMLGFGGAGTFLAAIGVPLAVAVTTALVGAYATFLEALQLETTIALYNQAAADLTAIRGWWTALPPERQVEPATVDRLVDHAERILRAEQTGWVQEMQDAMTQLRLEEAARSDDDGQPADGNGTERPDDDTAAAPAGAKPKPEAGGAAPPADAAPGSG